jgi:peptide/nickel transport system permease protein
MEAGAELAERGAGSRARHVLSLALDPIEGKIGAGLLILFVLVILFGPLVAPYDPTETAVSLPDEGPSSAHPLGTDRLGRDVLSRLLCGGASVIAIPLLATFLGFALGGVGGMVAGYLNGRFDRVFSVVVDIMLSVPTLLIVLVIIAAAGGSPPVLVLSVGLVSAPRIARVMRGATQGVAGTEYVQAAQARGEPTMAIVIREILPNIAPTAFVEFAVRLTYAIIFVATLNFLGLGAQPPSPNWGLMVSESRTTFVTDPIATLAPALAIGLVSVGISLIADAVTQSTRIRGSEEYAR